MVFGNDAVHVIWTGLIGSWIITVYTKVPVLSKSVNEIVSDTATFGFTMFVKDSPKEVKVIVVVEGKKLFIRILFPEGTIDTLPNVQLFSQKSPLFARVIEDTVHPAE